MTYGTNLGSGLVVELSGERTATHASAICLEDTIHFAYLVGSHTEARACAGTHGVRRGNKRIAAEVHIEQAALCTLAKHALAVAKIAVDYVLAIDELECLDIFYAFKPLFLQFSHIGVEAKCGKEFYVALFGCFIFLGKVVEHFAKSQTVAADFVGVSGTYTLAGSAYLSRTFECFVSGIEQTVSWQYKVYFLRDFEHLLNVDTTLLQVSCFSGKQNGV